MSPLRIAVPDLAMLSRISVLGEAAPSDKLRHMLKPSNGGTVESSLIPSAGEKQQQQQQQNK